MQKITPFLWYDGNAEEAMNFYLSVFKDGKVVNVSHMDGKVFTGTFELFGQQYHFINGGPMFKFTEAISLFVNCESQEEVDTYWEQLSAGGEQSRCGWLKDKFGLSWQIIPSALGRLMGDQDKEKAGRVMQAMMKMDKIVIAELQKAYDGE